MNAWRDREPGIWKVRSTVDVERAGSSKLVAIDDGMQFEDEEKENEIKGRVGRQEEESQSAKEGNGMDGITVESLFLELSVHVRAQAPRMYNITIIVRMVQYRIVLYSHKVVLKHFVQTTQIKGPQG